MGRRSNRGKEYSGDGVWGRLKWPLFVCLTLSLIGCVATTGDEEALPRDQSEISEEGETPVAVAEINPVPVLPTLLPTADSDFVTLTPIPTSTIPPTYTPRGTDTPIPSPTETPTAQVDNKATATAGNDELNEADETLDGQSQALSSGEGGARCGSVPAVPDYKRYYLGSRIWPQPLEDPRTHFWLDKPLPGGGRFLINSNFPYGWDGSGAYLLHNGVDSGAGLGTPVLAVADGTVVVARSDKNELWGWKCDWYGQLVVLELDEKWLGQPIYALYGHVLEINVEEGDRVVRGEQIAEVGFGGAAIVPHLHFEVRIGSNEYNTTRNPMLWIRPPETRGVVVGRLLDPNGRPWEGVWMSMRSLEDPDLEYISWTYLDDPQSLINADEGFAENFVISDVRPGRYRIYLEIQEVLYTADVEVFGGGLSTVEITTEPLRESDE